MVSSWKPYDCWPQNSTGAFHCARLNSNPSQTKCTFFVRHFYRKHGRIQSCRNKQQNRNSVAGVFQLEQEARSQSGTFIGTSSSNPSSSASHHRSQPKHGRSIACKMFPRNDRDDSCWSCGKPNHRLNKHPKKPNPRLIAAGKERWLKKRKTKNSMERILHEMALGLN